MEDELINISEEDIEINFYVDGEEYVVLNNYGKNLDEVYIAKVVSVDDQHETLISIDGEEYDKALDEYISILEDITEDEDEN